MTGADRLSTSRDSMTMKRIGFSQEWVSRDKRAARRNAAEALVNRQSVLVKAALADTRLQTALTYLDAFYAGEALKLTTLTEHHAHEELEAARGRLSSANASGQEVLALMGARGAAEDESAEVRQQQSASVVQLERWVGVWADELVAPTEALLPMEQDYVGAHPVVIALQREAEVARQEAAVMATNRDPNWTWGVSYGQRTGYSDMVSFGVSIPTRWRGASARIATLPPNWRWWTRSKRTWRRRLGSRPPSIAASSAMSAACRTGSTATAPVSSRLQHSGRRWRWPPTPPTRPAS